EDPGGPGQEKTPWARLQVDQNLDRSQQLRRELDLVDDHKAVVLDEPGRVVLGGPQSGSVIEQADDGARPTIGRQVCLGSKAAVVTWTVSSGHLDGVLVV